MKCSLRTQARGSLARLAALALLVFAAACPAAFAQAPSTGAIAGTATDPSGAAIAGATVLVRSEETNQEFTATTADNGTFNVPALKSGTYTVTLTAGGFKQSVARGVKVDVATTTTVNLALEVGAVTETVTVTAAGAELLNTQNTSVGTTIVGRQIVEQPQASRDALDLVTLLPGVQNTGRPRQSAVNGLPKSAINITIDGANVQDNLIKSQDGFFTYVRPRIDAIDEVTVSTATPGAESSGEGAVQIKFVTRSGTNDLTGSLYWYHREPTLSANYWFNNATLAPDPKTGKAPRNRVLLNQYGFRLGGPIRIPGLFDGRDKAFFFTNYEEFRIPEQQLRQRTVLGPNIFGGATPGDYRYVVGGETRTVNLLQIAAAVGSTSTLDPTVSNALSAIRNSFSQGTLSAAAAPNYQTFSFINTGGQQRYFPTVRFDYNVSKNHHFENVWNYQYFTGAPVDFLNNIDPTFPGFPNHAGQRSNRFSNSTALRSTLSPALVNEARFIMTGGTSLSGEEVSPAQFANQGGFDLALSDSCCVLAALQDITANAFPTLFAAGAFGNANPSRRNTPTKGFTDTLTWVRGAHSINFGGNFTQINYWSDDINQTVPTVYFGLNGTESIFSVFNTTPGINTFLPGASANQAAEAQAIYALLTGQVQQIFRQAFLNEQGSAYASLGNQVNRWRQREFGFFAQDSWRYRPNLTLNYGLRWEPQQSPVSLNNSYTRTDLAGVFGVSAGRGLFNPGAPLAGAGPAQYTALLPGERLYETDWNNFAPSVGLAYSPDWKSGILNRFFGGAGRSVLRAGYSLAYVREGLSIVTQPTQGNAGSVLDVSVNPNQETSEARLRDFNSGGLAGFDVTPVPPRPTFPLSGNAFDFATPSAFNPNLKTGYVQSWTAGFQRELTRDTVFEARYVGTRGLKLARRYNINELNVTENGFAGEFLRAQQNLAANRAAGLNSFAYTGNPGTSPLPVMLQYFTGQNSAARDPNNPANYTNSRFTNTALITFLLPNNSNVIGLANRLAGTAGFNSTSLASNGNFYFQNAEAAGLPRNFFIANPDAVFAGAAITDNGTHTWYDALQLELRRRMSHGLLLQASYTFSKAQTNFFASSQTALNNYVTLRDHSLSKRLSPFDQRHAFKVNWIYELPVGRGKSLLSGADGFVNHALGGWEFHGTARVQSGRAFRLGNVQLVGMTADELQDALQIRKTTQCDSAGQNCRAVVFFLPDDIIRNTQRAFTFSTATNAAGGYAPGTEPTGRFIAPPGYGGCVQQYAGQCGFSDLVLHGPRFVRADLSVVKRIRFTETMNLEMRGEFLNAFNNANFFVGGSAATDAAAVTNFNAAAFGQTTFAYQDVSTTNDPGGRLVQFVLRLNF